MKYCCSNCFDDTYCTGFINLHGQVLPTKCDYCGEDNFNTLDPARLNRLFEPLLSLIEEDDQGNYFWDLVDHYWSIFNRNIPLEKYELVSDILAKSLENLPNGYIGLKFRMKEGIQNPSVRDIWLNFCESIEKDNRYFHDNISIIKDKFESFSLFQAMEAKINRGQQYFRARICRANAEAYAPEQMGPPPVGIASAGRANPAGIPYLYLASQKDTAIHEVRPTILDKVTVAKFEVLEDLRVVDFRQISPLQFHGSDDYERLIGEIPMLRLIGEYLSRPIHHEEAHIKYTSTQYLSELIRFGGWNGILYTSSVHPEGYNFALFDPGLASCIDVIGTETISSISINV